MDKRILLLHFFPSNESNIVFENNPTAYFKNQKYILAAPGLPNSIIPTSHKLKNFASLKSNPKNEFDNGLLF